MTKTGAASLPSRLAVPFGLGCGILGAIGALAATTDLPARLFPPVAAERPVAAVPPVREAMRVVEPPRAHPAALRAAGKPIAIHAAAPPARHRMPPPVVMTWIPAHLLERADARGASRFEASADLALASAVAGPGGFVPPAEPAIAVAAAEPQGAPAPAPVRIAAVVPAPAAPPALAVPETAEEALEAALVPTPSARPNRAPAVATLRVRPAPPVAALAYARPDAGADEVEKPAFGGLFSRPARPGNGVAVYDIGAATVYLPSGERLEAHSGLGAMRDNPRFVHAKNRGPTPPHTYDLRLRESLFHGVAAIRLTPVGGERRIYNRVGLLAHTYMLGPRGDSNGCVSFKDYKRFLAAFRRGEVRRLVVVSHMNDPSSRLASLFGRRG